MAKFKSKIQQTYEAVLADPSASSEAKLESAKLLDAYRERKKHRRNHTKAKALVGLGARDRIKDLTGPAESLAIPESVRCTDPVWRLVYAGEGSTVSPPLTAEERIEADKIKQQLKITLAKTEAEITAELPTNRVPVSCPSCRKTAPVAYYGKCFDCWNTRTNQI